MSVLSDEEIIRHVKEYGMIEPFIPEGISGDGLISYGLTSSGYDVRLDTTVLFYKNTYGHIIDPKRFKDSTYAFEMFDRRVYGEHEPVTIPSYGYILGQTMERFRIPRHIKGICTGKSTYARCGIIVNVTPLEPDWEGQLTIEISNSSPCPACVYVGEGIAQIEFHPIVGNVLKSYADKKGKYQNQTEVTTARVL